ncbi:hypothetical protein ASA1KI_21440 [Opitutales bacterium ASA1]|uniref:AlbA family DNA-binding domain-containing protein n=1 Tax=Congregicoccus parvus TaxID=3081749 RepID=UPI002B2C369F|nr:hypothetical protein ASA1KI_21440 [Opitutales bacterium ASA1]
MSLARHTVNALTEAAILSLKENSVRESRDLDFKRTYSLKEDREKREFACDVAAMANTVGGDLVYGVEDADGVATAVPGIDPLLEDSERLRIESLLASALAPRVNDLSFKSIALATGKVVFVVRVPPSVNAPHMVTYGGEFRFYGRHSSGKFHMDVHQVRDAFVASDAIANKLRAFRRERIDWIEHREVGSRLPKPNLVVVHLLPLSALRGGPVFDGQFLRKVDALKLAPLRTAGGIGDQLNLDGKRIFSSIEGGRIVGYVQLFRNGCIEVVDSAMLSNKPILPAAYERVVRDGVHRLIATMRELGLDGDIAVAISLLQVRGYSLVQEEPRLGQRQDIELDQLLLPEVSVESGAVEAQIDAALRQPFDLVWNACGKTGSPNYDAESRWKKPSEWIPG